jgi:hypothetical protein
MAKIATTAEGVPELHKKHDVSCVAFQTLVFSLAFTEVALWGVGLEWLALAGAAARAGGRPSHARAVDWLSRGLAWSVAKEPSFE